MKTELSDGEWRLMKVLWSSGSMTIAQLTGALKEGVVCYQSNGRAKVYSPVLRQGDAVQREANRFLNKVFDGRIGVMLNAMMDSCPLTREDLEELSAILEKAKEESHD